MKWWQIKKRDEDLERELRSDLELEEEEQRENGLSAEDASYAARRAFGPPLESSFPFQVHSNHALSGLVGKSSFKLINQAAQATHPQCTELQKGDKFCKR